jgi:hypothetical protein
MVMQISQGSVEVYEIYDDRGEAIGRVVRPVERMILGRDSGTVLLIRKPS